MKRIIAILLLAVMLLGLAACSTVNKTEVAILWSGDGKVTDPNSLENAMERAMYIERIAYAHYGAGGDQEKQLTQASQALEKGAPALMVQLVDPSAAQSVLDLAKDVPVVFFGCDVDETALTGGTYAVVRTDSATRSTVQGEAIAAQLIDDYQAKKSQFKSLDVNGDGKITYLAQGDVAASVEAANAQLTKENVPNLTAAADCTAQELTVQTVTVKKTEYGLLTTPAGDAVEMIISDSDETTLQTLVTLQSKGFNKDKLTTHCVAIITAGCEADYKAHVLAGKPEGADAIKAYYEQNIHLVDLTGIDESDEDGKKEMEALIYNTMNVVDDGRILNTVMEDYDTISEQAAKILRAMLKGETPEESVVKVSYKAYVE